LPITPSSTTWKSCEKNPDAAQISTHDSNWIVFTAHERPPAALAKSAPLSIALSNDLDQKLSNDIIPKFVEYCGEQKTRNLQSLDTQPLIRPLEFPPRSRAQSISPLGRFYQAWSAPWALAELKSLLDENFWDDDPDQLAAALAASRQPDKTLLSSAQLMNSPMANAPSIRGSPTMAIVLPTNSTSPRPGGASGPTN